jgi:hypothetical protein
MSGALAAGLLWLAADTVEPQVLSIEWPDGVEIVAATNADTCSIAATALLSGLWRPVGRPEPPLSASCATGNAFAADAFCVHGYTCEKRGRNAR